MFIFSKIFFQKKSIFLTSIFGKTTKYFYNTFQKNQRWEFEENAKTWNTFRIDWRVGWKQCWWSNCPKTKSKSGFWKPLCGISLTIQTQNKIIPLEANGDFVGKRVAELQDKKSKTFALTWRNKIRFVEN